MRSSNAFEGDFTLGFGLSILESGLNRGHDEEIREAAKILESVQDKGLVSVKWEPFVTALAALGYDSIGENYRAKRPYNKLLDINNPIPVSEIFFGSTEMARLFTRIIASFGLRDLKLLGKNLDIGLEFCARESARHSEISDDLLSLTSMMTLLQDYRDTNVETKSDFSELAIKAQTLEDSIQELDISPWLSLLAILLGRSIGSSLKRSILPLAIPKYLKQRLVERRIVELWPPQQEAAEKKLFEGKNIVYAAPPASGKTLLSLLASVNSAPNRKTVYLVPTRTLAQEAYTQLREYVESESVQIGISTRDRTEFDDTLGETSVLVTTYEKLNPLLRKGKIDSHEISRLLVDEVQKLSDEDRGISLEFILSKYKSLPVQEDPQIVAISGMVRKNDAERLSNWLNSSLISSDWKPVDLDETILCEGRLLHKDGRVENVPLRSTKHSGSRAQRTQLGALLARQAVVTGGQCLVAIESRRKVEEFAEFLKGFFSSAHFDIDLQTELEKSKDASERVHAEILGLEPEVSSGYIKLAQLIRYGIGYHHAGLPSSLRAIVEKAVREKIVRVLVSTTTFEAGVNLPVSHVVFPFAMGGGVPMKISTYRNLSGRAGRPGYDMRGQSTVITLNQDEMNNARVRFFDGEPEPLESAVQFFLRKRPPARYAIQAQILSLAKMDDTIETQDISSLIGHTWFWHNSAGELREQFAEGVRTETRKLQRYGFVEILSQGQLKITQNGKIANRSSLLPFSTKLLLDNLVKIIRSGYEGEKFDWLVLSLVSLPFELEDSDEYLENVPIPEDLKYITQILTVDPYVRELYQRVELGPRYAVVLRHWIEGVPLDEILRISGLNPSTDASLLEGTLPSDAYWIISSLIEMLSGTRASPHQRERIHQIANFCRFGTKNAVIIGLLEIGFKHLGRETALKLASYMARSGKTLREIGRDDILSLFPGRTDACNRLYDEIAEYSKINRR